MAIGSALSIAMSGLRATRSEVEVVAGNIAGADVRGFTRRTVIATQLAAGAAIGVGTRVTRELDGLLQKSFRSATSEASAADVRLSFLSRLDQLYGGPQSESSLDATLGRFAAGLQTLATSPDDPIARSEVVARATALAERLNAMSAEVQGLRTEADEALGEGAAAVDGLLERLHALNRAIVAEKASGGEPVALLDQRDAAIDELSSFLPVEVQEGADGAVAIRTASGIPLLGAEPARLAFDGRGELDPASLWSADPAARGVGTITLTAAGGTAIDLIAEGALRTGRLGALVAARDSVLVEAQNQLDALAASLASALSDRTIAGTSAASGAAAGFQIDLAALEPGNVVRLEVVSGGVPRTVSLVRVDDPATLPLGDDATPEPGDQVVGIDFSGGTASIAAEVQAALGPGFAVSDPSGATLRILDDGAAGTTDVTALSATVTAGLQDGSPALPLFVDSRGGATPYSGSLDGGPQRLGFAARIVVDPAVTSDPSLLVAYRDTPPVEAGDATRPQALADRLAGLSLTFASDTGIGSPAAPFRGPVAAFLRQVIGQRGVAVEAARNGLEQRQAAFANLAARVNETSGVSIDTELARLIQVQTAYAANARVLQAVREMLDVLDRI